MNTRLTLTHLCFDAIACSPIKLGEHQAGERLRDALANVMLRAVCPETLRRSKPTPEHAAACPACWLLAAEIDGGGQNRAGEVRRAYSLAPPWPPRDMVAPGERFSFALTLFGQGFQYLPYFVLAMPEMGREGVGPGRGKFELEAIWAADPLRGRTKAVLRRGEGVVRVPDLKLDWAAACLAAERLAEELDDGRKLRIQFMTPTRLVEGEALVKTPDFGVFFQRLMHRIDELSRQHAGEDRRPREEVEKLHRLADGVRLVEAKAEWVDLWGPSNRTGKKTPMGGLVGWADYRARDWGPLLPWLVFGQAVQVGKLTVKGNGLFQIARRGGMGYWEEVIGRKETAAEEV